MLELFVKNAIEKEKEEVIFCKKWLEGAESDVMILFWNAEIQKHEHAIEVLNSVLNLSFYLTR